mmetsp:Transcript_59802/g.129633  ORF Transcript_59802/g.129633 Transcript_59802/m.129633 type:complete len:235 (-) Transcript_59802:538-1242(-)
MYTSRYGRVGTPSSARRAVRYHVRLALRWRYSSQPCTQLSSSSEGSEPLEQVEMRAKAHCITMEESSGIVRLSFKWSGSKSSVSVAVSAPKKTGYSRSRTEAKTEHPITKQTRNIAEEPSIDFLPPRPSFMETVSPPKETPMMAALMSPSTRKRIEAMAIDGGDKAMQSVQPRLKKHAPVRCVFSSSRRMDASGQWRATVSKLRRAVSAAQPTVVMSTQRPTQKRLLKSCRSSS